MNAKREPITERLLDFAGDAFLFAYLALMFSLPFMGLGLIVFGIVSLVCS